MAQVFTGFETRKKVWFTILKAKRQDETHDPGFQQL